MRIVSCDRITYSRDHGFPAPWEASDTQLQSTDYVTELWPMTGPLLHVSDDLRIVVSFDDLRQSFDDWEQGDDSERYATVFDWLRDCIGNGLHPCTVRG